MFRYKLVIFDFDGTLFATHQAIIHSVIRTFEAMKKVAPTHEAIYSTINKGKHPKKTFRPGYKKSPRAARRWKVRQEGLKNR